MNAIRRFKAKNAKKAIEAVHGALGPDAVVVNIRKISKGGLNGFFQSPEVEITAMVPGVHSNVFDQEEISRIQKKKSEEKVLRNLSDNISHSNPVGRLDLLDDTPIEIPRYISSVEEKTSTPSRGLQVENHWSVKQVLESIGVLPLYIEKLIGSAKLRYPNYDTVTLGEQLTYVRLCLLDHWSGLYSKAQQGMSSRKLLLGPPGSGKTTALCKWMTQTVLGKRMPTKVWRLDGHLANTAEMLTVHAEMLDVPVTRLWTMGEMADTATQFIDLPGVSPSDVEGVKSVASLVNKVQPTECLLVLNAAYEIEHLIELVRAFSDFPLNGLVMTHLDQEKKWSKLWNLTLSVDLPILYWSGGQEMPGDFVEVTPETLFRAVLPENHSVPGKMQEKEVSS